MSTKPTTSATQPDVLVAASEDEEMADLEEELKKTKPLATSTPKGYNKKWKTISPYDNTVPESSDSEEEKPPTKKRRTSDGEDDNNNKMSC